MREGRDLIRRPFVLVFFVVVVFFFFGERERERRKRGVFFILLFFSLFFFSAVEETFKDLFTEKGTVAASAKTREEMELPRGARPPPDEYFASEFNVINNNNGVPGQRDEGGASNGDASPKWSLRGFLPPAHLRIELYRYANRDVRPEESEEESPAGRLTPTPRTPQRQMNGESTEMLTRGVLL